jgi:hypothetical protein
MGVRVIESQLVVLQQPGYCLTCGQSIPAGALAQVIPQKRSGTPLQFHANPRTDCSEQPHIRRHTTNERPTSKHLTHFLEPDTFEPSPWKTHGLSHDWF